MATALGFILFFFVLIPISITFWAFGIDAYRIIRDKIKNFKDTIHF